MFRKIKSLDKLKQRYCHLIGLFQCNEQLLVVQYLSLHIFTNYYVFMLVKVRQFFFVDYQVEFTHFTYSRQLNILISHCHWKTLAGALAKAINWGSWASWIFNIWQIVIIVIIVHILDIFSIWQIITNVTIF